jgi:hypothetical protein
MAKLSPSVKLSEADVTKQVTDFLRFRGWTLIRLNSGLFNTKDGKRTYQIGEKGQADWLALKAVPILSGVLPLANVIFLELKAPGKKPRADQQKWLEAKRRDGFHATWTDSLDRFIQWYQAGGGA